MGLSENNNYQVLKNKRFLIFIPFLTPGGAETQAFLLADFLNNKAGCEVEVWAFDKPGALIEKLEQQHIKWRIYPIKPGSLRSRYTLFMALLKLTIALRTAEFDVLIPFTYYPNLYLSAVWRFTKAGVCIWNQRGLETQVPVSRIEQWAMGQKAAYAANSNACKNYIAQRHAIPLQNITVIPNGSEFTAPEQSQAQWRYLLKTSPETPVVLMLANYYPEKDHITVLKAWQHLLNNNTFKTIPRLVFAGYALQESTINKIKSAAFDLELHNSIVFLESTTDAAGLVAMSDICLLSTLSEGCSNSLLEYMQHSKPVIATGISANKEVLGAHYPYLFEPQDHLTLSTQLYDLLHSPEKAALLGQDNKQRVDSLYSIEKMEQGYVTLIATSLKK